MENSLKRSTSLLHKGLTHARTHAQSGLSAITSAIFFFKHWKKKKKKTSARVYHLLQSNVLELRQGSLHATDRRTGGGMDGWMGGASLSTWLFWFVSGFYGNYLIGRLRWSRGVGASLRVEVRDWGHWAKLILTRPWDLIPFWESRGPDAERRIQLFIISIVSQIHGNITIFKRENKG